MVKWSADTLNCLIVNIFITPDGDLSGDKHQLKPGNSLIMYKTYSCNNTITTLIQISRLFYFGFFSKTNHQMMDLINSNRF